MMENWFSYLTNLKTIVYGQVSPIQDPQTIWGSILYILQSIYTLVGFVYLKMRLYKIVVRQKPKFSRYKTIHY
ncbi:TPA_asm: P6 [Bouteloa betacytorhabdovirus 1]|nr:TPA_asm: P6 [Bouteloa betacytorhabdovirus 1]